MTEQTTTPTLTAEAAQERLTAAMTTYRAANETITLASLFLIATNIRAEFGDAAQFFVAEWSDQGDYLCSGLTVECGPDGAQDYDDNDCHTSNLDEPTQATWSLFAAPIETPTLFRFDVARILADVPPLLAPEPEPTALDTAALIAAVASMAAVLGDGMTACDVAGHMTCTEAETVADVLRAAGHDEAADVWIAGHATSDDDPEDLHYDQRDAFTEDDAEDLDRCANGCVCTDAEKAAAHTD